MSSRGPEIRTVEGLLESSLRFGGDQLQYQVGSGDEAALDARQGAWYPAHNCMRAVSSP